jgi:hypothetical protein
VVHYAHSYNRPVQLALLVFCRRVRFHNRRSIGQPDGIAIQHKQPVPQRTPRLDLMKLFKAALRDAAGCFFRHLLTCLTVAPGIGRDLVFAYPLTLLQKFPAVSAEQFGECRIQRSVRGKALHQHHPYSHLKRKDGEVFDDFQILSE